MPSFSFMLAPVDRGGIVSARLGFHPLAVFEAAVEAALVAVVADAGPCGFDAHQHGVLVAIGGDFLHGEAVAGGLALEPELLARAAVEGGETGLDGAAEGFLVHVADHQDAAGIVILDDRRDQSVELGKIQIHANSNKKARHCRRASFLISIWVESGQRPPRVDWAVMMMPGGGNHKPRV
jgi:hypothetical protein